MNFLDRRILNFNFNNELHALNRKFFPKIRVFAHFNLAFFYSHAPASPTALVMLPGRLAICMCGGMSIGPDLTEIRTDL